MTNFPLYDSLTRDLPKKDLSVKQKEELVEKLNKIDENGRDLVYALIQVYNINNQGEESKSLPYGGESEVNKGKEDITWNLTEFPIKLRRTLYKFVVMHSQNMEEQAKRPKLPP